MSDRSPIEAGEELTYDYNIAEEFDVACIGGARRCRGKLGK